MNFNGENLTSELTNGGTINGSLEVVGNFNSTDSIGLVGKYTLPTTAPLEAGSVIVSDGSQQLIWTGDLSIGDVSSITSSSVNNEVVLFNGVTGKSVKNSLITVNAGIVQDKGEEMSDDNLDSSGALLTYKKSRLGGAVQASDLIGGIQYKAHDGTSFENVCLINCRSSANMTPSNHSSQLLFYTTNDNSTTPTLKLTVWDEGVEVEDNIKIPKISYMDAGITKFYAEALGDWIYYYKGDGTSVSGYSLGFNQYYLSANSTTGHRTYNFRSRGTESTPLAMIDGDSLNDIVDIAHNGVTYYQSTRINTKATENWTSLAAGSSITFYTTDNGTLTQSEKLKLDTDGVSTPENITVEGNNKQIILRDNISGAGLCNASLSFHDVNDAGVTSLSCSTGPLIFYHLGTPEFSISPTETVSLNNATTKGTHTLGDSNAGTHYILPSTKGTSGQHLKLDGGNNMIWTNDTTYIPPILSYGEMFFQGNNVPVTMPNQGAYYLIDNGTFLTGVINGFALGTNVLTYTAATPGVFKVAINVSWSNGGAGNETFSIGVYRNGSILQSSTIRAALNSTNVYPRNCSVECLTNLTNGTNIAPVVSCITAALPCTIVDINFNVFQIQ
jgi:hypothetical protein